MSVCILGGGLNASVEEGVDELNTIEMADFGIAVLENKYEFCVEGK